MGTDSIFPLFYLKGGIKIPRRARRLCTSSYYHIMTQGINKLNIYETNKEKNTYLKYLNEEKEKNRIKLLAYTVMDNHAHLLIYNQSGQGIPNWMKIVNTKYARFYNREHNRVGYVYRDRYKSKPILTKEYLYNVIAYIHYNPIEAGLAKELGQYIFSSYNDFLYYKKEKEEIELLFEDENYKSIFNLIHYNYNQKRLINSKKNPEKILQKYLQNKSIEEIKKDKVLLAKIVKDLKSETELKNFEICQILKIGKNRISKLIKEGFIEKNIFSNKNES